MLHMLKRDYAALLAALRDVLPEEGCGLLGGRNGRVLRTIPVTNIHHSATRYAMEPAEQVRGMLALEAAELTLLAIYHSHPQGPAAPSATDLAHWHYPDAAQLIVSFAQPDAPEAHVFAWRNGRVAQLPLHIE